MANLLQHSCLENSMDRGAWWTVVHGVMKSQTLIERLRFHFSLSCIGEGNWQPTPIFLPRKFHGQRSLVGYRPWGHKELDTTELLHFLSFFCFHISYIFPVPWDSFQHGHILQDLQSLSLSSRKGHWSHSLHCCLDVTLRIEGHRLRRLL